MVWEIFVFLVLTAASYGVFLALRDCGGIRGRSALGKTLFGLSLSLPTRLLAVYVLDSMGWATQISTRVSPLVALFSSVFVVSFLEHLVLVVVVWPAYRSHQLERAGTALSVVGVAAAGFGVGLGLLSVMALPSASSFIAALGGFSSRLFFAGIWASCLATSRVKYRNWFLPVWLLAVILDGFVRHLLLARGLGFQVVALPPLLCMFVIGWYVVQKLRGPRESVVFGQHHLLGLHVDHHQLDNVRAAFQHNHRPALIHWIVGGALVNFGASLLALALGVALAHALAIDLSCVDESNAEAMAPLLLLGASVLMSFPLAGFLTAKASAADSLFEPGVAAVISIASLTLLLSRSAPLTIVLGLALAPLAFALACMGAWFGLSRTPSGQH